VARPLLWLLGGLVVLALAIVAMAPELVTDLGMVGGLVLLASAAGIPGVLLLLTLAARRRGHHADPAPATSPPAGHGPEDRPTAACDEPGA
jgi:hypothetical protein